MNKSEFASKLADEMDVSKKMADEFINAFQKVVTRELVDDGDVVLSGFGKFSSRERKARMGVNPQNPDEKIHIPAVTVPKFKAGKALKDALKGEREVE
jgi:DNA-binding protein HU-beta